MGLMLELVRSQPNLAQQYLQVPQPTLKTVITAIILASVAEIYPGIVIGIVDGTGLTVILN